jgi:hypothetical protein
VPFRKIEHPTSNASAKVGGAIRYVTKGLSNEQRCAAYEGKGPLQVMAISPSSFEPRDVDIYGVLCTGDGRIAVPMRSAIRWQA